MQEIHISMQEVKNYYAGRKGSPREVRNPDNSDPTWLLPSCYWISWSWRHKVRFSSFGVGKYSCFVSVHGTPNIASKYQQMNLFSHIILILQYLRTDEFSFTLLNAKVSVVSITWTTNWRTYWLVQNIFFWVMKQKTQFWACGPCWESSLLTIVIF